MACFLSLLKWLRIRASPRMPPYISPKTLNVKYSDTKNTKCEKFPVCGAWPVACYGMKKGNR